LKQAKDIIEDWYIKRNWHSFPFQQEMMDAYLSNHSGLLNAPTGSGKTLAMWMPILAEYISSTPDYKKHKSSGMQVLWITPLRALARDIQSAMQQACNDLEIPWTVACRTGDTSSAEKLKQKKHIPQCLITTPESLHVMLSQKGYPDIFKNIKAIVIDEWHEILGTKRGVQVELGLSRIKGLRQIDHSIKIWGISATIGNLEEALQVLLGKPLNGSYKIIRSAIDKKIEIETLLPEEIEKFPWSGHLGIKLIDKILKVIESSGTTLVFTNTRSQTEIWYQYLLLHAPHLAGAIALHHGSLDNELRNWVENALHEGKLKVVVCTSSLDLGVDFRPVDTVIQIGGPKGVARFLQRAGRSGHQPGATSRIYFVPTNSLELIEAAALKTAVKERRFESRKPLQMSIDVLVQYLVTLAVSEGFVSEKLFEEVKGTYAYQKINSKQWEWTIDFITTGGKTLSKYDEFLKVIKEGDVYKVTSRKIAMRHKLSIGTIVGDPVLKIKYMKGSYIGSIEEYFISKLNPGDVIWFAGRNLEFVKIYEMTVYVKKAGSKKGQIPRWYGGRMPLSSQMAEMIRKKVEESISGNSTDVELQKLEPLLQIQRKWSVIPNSHQLLVEKFQSREGCHVFIYPFEGRYVHELLAAVLAYRISKVEAFSFSIAMNDYGFELLSDKDIPIEEAIRNGLFSPLNLFEDIKSSINDGEMAKRKFRDIATIAGLVFQGYPGKNVKTKHLQASAQLFFEVFMQYDPENLLLDQSYEEVLNFQLEQSRFLSAMQRLNQQEVVITFPPKPTPFAFPILVDRMREKMSNEKLEDRIQKMQLQLEKYAEKTS
jgi:ATP-dependent Lhr-like helicase